VTAVWITRTLPGAEATADRVRAAGFQPFIAPLLEVRFENRGEVDLTDVRALAFTSANGVRAFVATTRARDLPVFAVGRGTAAVARAAGFNAVHASDGGVLELASKIAKTKGEGVVLHPGPAEPAGSLVDSLDALGIPARTIVVYRTRRAKLSVAQVTAAAASDFVLLQSVKASRIFGFLHINTPTPVCLSPAVAAVLRTRRAFIATSPTEAALIEALIEAAR
jgi:uroporphyrinogen-III synthase